MGRRFQKYCSAWPGHRHSLLEPIGRTRGFYNPIVCVLRKLLLAHTYLYACFFSNAQFVFVSPIKMDVLAVRSKNLRDEQSKLSIAQNGDLLPLRNFRLIENLAR